MFALPPEAEGIPIVIEVEGLDESQMAELQPLFSGPGERVVFSHGFGGADTVNLVATLGRSTLEKLVSVWPKIKASSRKTSVRIDRASLTLQGFTAEELNAMFASPQFLKAIKLVKSK